MKKRKRRIRMGAEPVIFFVTFCILGGVVGIWINSRIHARETKNLDSSELHYPF
jgi:hypothetical protein